MPNFRKKPVEIEAVLWEGGLFGSNGADAIEAWSKGATACRGYDGEDGLRLGIFIKTLEGEMRADPGDWIIRGVKGEFYPCKPDIFEATYERVSE